jgi:hypothetical protein
MDSSIPQYFQWNADIDFKEAMTGFFFSTLIILKLILLLSELLRM